MSVIKKVPIPLCGVMLGLAALGNLLQSYGEPLHAACGIAATILLVLVLLKLAFFPRDVAKAMGDPIQASVSGTFPMALMLLSGYLKPFAPSVAFAVWVSAVLLHLLLIVYFTLKFIVHFNLKKVFASYYIVYVGIVVASVTAPAFGAESTIGTWAFWFGFVSLIALLVLVSYRYATCGPVPEPARPLICIYAAPVSLCIAGYVQSVMPKSLPFLLALWAVSAAIYVFALVKAIGYFKIPFYPSYAAFTFPFVISAIASKQLMACALNLGSPLAWLQPIVLVQTLVAAVFVVYTLVRYLGFLFAGSKA